VHQKKGTRIPYTEITSAYHLETYLRMFGYAEAVEFSLALIRDEPDPVVKLFELVGVLGPLIGVTWAPRF